MVKLTSSLLAALKEGGIECFLPTGSHYPDNTFLHPPCSLKWLAAHHFFMLGSFSYAVRGFFFNTEIGRYTSIGESVQVGRGDHPTTWLSTSPAFYRVPPLFEVGRAFEGGESFHAYRARPTGNIAPTILKRTVIGNDVYIGHGAFIRPGVRIGNGAVVGAQAVVVRDVPPYAVVAGNPAVVKKFRLPEELIPDLLALEWWNYAPWQLEGIDFTQPKEAIRSLPEKLSEMKRYDPAVISLSELEKLIARRDGALR